MISSSHSDNRFATTRWSVVMQLAATESTGAQGALIELAQRYWYPVYAYVRRCGHVPAIAEDITRCFLQHLLQQFPRTAQQLTAQGHFRRYLLDQLNAFLAGDWRETVVDESSPELARPRPIWNRAINATTPSASSPEQTYQRSFALEVLGRAFKRLRSEARQTGHLDMYEALEAVSWQRSASRRVRRPCAQVEHASAGPGGRAQAPASALPRTGRRRTGRHRDLGRRSDRRTSKRCTRVLRQVQP